MKKTLLILIALTGCNRMTDYQPTLSSRPADESRYAADLASCKAEPRKAHTAENLAVGATWAVGMLALAAGGDDDYFKTPMTLVDECMARKGYAVIPVRHCC